MAHGNSLRALFVHLGIKDEKTIEFFEIGTGVPIQLDVEDKTYKYLNAYTLCAYQIIDSRGYPSLEVQCFDKESHSGKIKYISENKLVIEESDGISTIPYDKIKNVKLDM